jgi:hypothetical protein
LRIFLSGTGSNGEPVFSKTDINFGAVDTGNCADDTITVSNVCPSPITVTLSSVPAPFSIVSPASGQLTLAGGGMEKIVYRYCPKNVESDSELHTITDQNTKQYLVTLRGSGKQVASLPLIRFALASAEAVAGQAFDYTISIDSLAGSVSLNTMSAALEYDPLVFQPLRITPSVSGIAMNGSETKPGRFDLVATASGAVLSRGEFAKVTIMPLLSKHDHTVVEMKDIILAPQAEVATANGSLNVVRCAPPAQNIVIPGDFAFGHIEPNPASGDVSVHMTLGADGALTLSVSNMWGEVVRRTVFTGLTKGSHELHLSLAGLASGEYFITADSWGWRDSQKLIISK